MPLSEKLAPPQEMSRLVANEVENMEQLIKIIGLKAQ